MSRSCGPRSLCGFVVLLLVVACGRSGAGGKTTTDTVIEIPTESLRMTDGTILSAARFSISKEYDAQDELTKFRFPRDVYDAAKSAGDFMAWRIVYASGGLKITGIIYGPRTVPGRRLPAIVYCRGGTGDFGALDESDLVTFHEWAKLGYVVLASNYRGGGGSEGVDTWCGDDVDDVISLFAVAKTLDFIDAANLFLIGLSRGGPMALIAVKRGFPARAAAIMAGISDFSYGDIRRPEFIDGDDDEFRKIGWPGWRHVWPDFERKCEEHYRLRSAVEWAEYITAPILILHARDDPRVPVGHAQRLAAALERVGAEKELVVYEHDGHSLPLNRVDRDRRIDAFFRKHIHRN